MCVPVSVCVCAHVCVCVRVGVISEIKHSFQSLRYLINYLLLKYTSDFLNLCHVGLYDSRVICMLLIFI